MKEKLMGMLRALRSKLVVLKDKVFGVKKYFTLKTLSWVVPAVIIVVGLVVLFAVPAGDSQKKTDGDDTLAAVEGANSPASVVGMYESGLLPAASTPGREFTLALAEDGSASFVADYKTGDRLVDEIGTWTRADDRLTVTITKRFGHDVESALYVFTIAGDSLSLVDYEYSRWGAMGLTLTRKK
jgi:hypothetical protein